MPTDRDGGVVWCEVCAVCQQSETEVWCGVKCVRCAKSQRRRCGVVLGVRASWALIQADTPWSTPPYIHNILG